MVSLGIGMCPYVEEKNKKMFIYVGLASLLAVV